MSVNTFNSYRAKILLLGKDLTHSTSKKILHLLKTKVFIPTMVNAAQMTEFAFEIGENIKGKGENPGYKHFLHYPQCFAKLSLFRSLKPRTMW